MKYTFPLYLFLIISCLTLSSQSKGQCVGDFIVETSTGDTVVNICVGNADTRVAVAAQIRGFPIMYVLVDANNTILDVTTNPVFDFKNAPPGVCRIYAATFKGRILNTVGELLDNAVLTTLCAELSSNVVTIIRGSADESTVSIRGGGTDTIFCSQDGVDDILNFENTPTSQNYTYLVTDVNGVILAVTTDEVNFEGAPAGICHVYGLSYDGTLLAMPGNTIDDILSEGCWRLSDNRVEVTRTTTDAGMIMTSDSLTQLVICVGDGESDSLYFISPGADPNANYTYIVTDDTDTILAVLSGNVIDFEGAGVGVCRVYGVAYSGNLNANAGMHIDDITSDGTCQGITANYIRVQRSAPMEGRITTLQGDTVVYTCPGDGIDDIVSVNILSGGSPVIFIITDIDNNVLGTSADQQINFEAAGEGDCYIWRSSYTGNLLIDQGDVLFDDPVSDGCFVISDNSVEVIRRNASAGEIVDMNGAITNEVCVGDGVSDIFTFEAEYNLQASFVLVVTNDSNEVLQILDADSEIDFDGAGSGTCRVFGVSYNGELLLKVGDDILVDDIASACADITDNYVEFIRSNVDPGVIFTQYGTTVFTCPGDGNSDELYLSRSSNADTSIVIITDNSGVVLALPTSDTVDLEGAGEGICLIWGLSFDGAVLVEVGDTIMGQPLATGCFSLTDPVFVIRRVPYTDRLTSINGDTSVEFCTSDGIDDIIVLTYSPADDFPIEYVITDSFGTILATTSSDTLNFEGVPTGVCRIYAVAYTGFFTGQAGQNIGAAVLSDDCYAISDNYVEVIREEPIGGQITSESGDTRVYICPGDGNPDIVHFAKSGDAGSNFQYIITSDEDVILGLPPADSADFDQAPIGICRVYGLSYSGTLLAEMGDTLTAQMLSDKCYALSSNFLEVVRDTAEAGTIATSEGDTLVQVVQSDTISDVFTYVASGASNAESRFVVTDANNLVLVILTGNVLDFSQVPEGEYRVYHISFTGNLLLSGGFNVVSDAISDDCYDVSDNFVRMVVSANFNSEDDHRLNLPSTIADGNNSELRVFPNPARNEINLKNIGLASRVAVVDVLGNNVFQSLTSELDENRININQLRPGLYFALTFDESGSVLDQIQFIKE